MKQGFGGVLNEPACDQLHPQRSTSIDRYQSFKEFEFGGPKRNFFVFFFFSFYWGEG